MTRSAFLVITDQFLYHQHNRLYGYLTEHGLLLADCKSLNRLQTLHSTLTSLLDVTNDWFLNLDKGL